MCASTFAVRVLCTTASYPRSAANVQPSIARNASEPPMLLALAATLQRQVDPCREAIASCKPI
eukprot:5766432-Prorocentrum_lima.AAC.1